MAQIVEAHPAQPDLYDSVYRRGCADGRRLFAATAAFCVQYGASWAGGPVCALRSAAAAHPDGAVFGRHGFRDPEFRAGRARVRLVRFLGGGRQKLEAIAFERRDRLCGVRFPQLLDFLLFKPDEFQLAVHHSVRHLRDPAVADAVCAVLYPADDRHDGPEAAAYLQKCVYLCNSRSAAQHPDHADSCGDGCRNAVLPRRLPRNSADPVDSHRLLVCKLSVQFCGVSDAG